MPSKQLVQRERQVSNAPAAWKTAFAITATPPVTPTPPSGRAGGQTTRRRPHVSASEAWTKAPWSVQCSECDTKHAVRSLTPNDLARQARKLARRRESREAVREYDPKRVLLRELLRHERVIVVPREARQLLRCLRL